MTNRYHRNLCDPQKSGYRPPVHANADDKVLLALARFGTLPYFRLGQVLAMHGVGSEELSDAVNRLLEREQVRIIDGLVEIYHKPARRWWSLPAWLRWAWPFPVFLACISITVACL
jgi:hypothetical protein